MATKRTLKSKSLAYMRDLKSFDQQVDEVTQRRSRDDRLNPHQSRRECADAIEAIQTRFAMLEESGVDPALLEIGKLFRRYLETDRKKYELGHQLDSERGAYEKEHLSGKGILVGVLSVMFGDRDDERADNRRVAAMNRKADKANALIGERNELAHRYGVKMRAVEDAYREKGWIE